MSIAIDELEMVMFLTVDLLEHWLMPKVRSTEAS
jgi:hypothetical protein